mgnify:CR=1 FL=1|jgi:Ca2+-binding EF-hand superfamily protein
MTFRNFDKDGSGVLTKQELKQAFVEYKVAIEDFELNDLFR